MCKFIILVLLVFSNAGCNTIPFQKINDVPLEGINPQMVRAQFAQRLPQKFELMNSTVFAYRHLKFSCLGPIRVDALNRSLTVVGLNQVGVKLFDLSVNHEVIESKYIFPELTKHGDFAKAVCEDIKRIYLDRLPPAESIAILKKYKLIFRAPKRDGFFEYVFAGKDNLLIEKHCYMNGCKLWSVFYYEYIVKNGKVFPAGVILRHYGYNYCLVVRLKEIRESE
jgi:hypothetical protein